jgi:hypothetical protein
VLEGLRISMLYGKAVRHEQRQEHADAAQVLRRAMALLHRCENRRADWVWLFWIQVCGLLAKSELELGNRLGGREALVSGLNAITRYSSLDISIANVPQVREWKTWARGLIESLDAEGGRE